MEDLIFIILRHVSQPQHNQLYIECYNRVRKLYANKIYIIDDNSNKEILVNHDMSNVEIIQSEFPGKGEILPYYYMYHKKLGKKAIILQDSMFIHKKIDTESVEDYKFLWSFDSNRHKRDYIEQFNSYTFKLDSFEDLYDIFCEDYWHGCFGSTMIITLDFLVGLQERTKFLDSIANIVSREHRCMFERLIAVLCYYVKPKTKEEISLMGDIFNQVYPWGTPYGEYLKNRDRYDNVPIFKVCNAR